MSERLRAAFYRGGTSKAVVFNGADLPADTSLRDRIFLHVLGSPDPYGRQLNGLGGGLSSLSKVVIVAPSARADADVDYTFGQVSVSEPLVDYGSACGNMSSCVGPFAVSEGMVAVKPGASEAVVRIFDTNMGQIYHARFPVKDGAPVEDGDFAIPGVSGTGAKVQLDFLNPGGAGTGSLLPTGNAVDVLDIDGIGPLPTALIDAANPVVFCQADALGKTATERPETLDTDPDFMTRMERIRHTGALAMGMANDTERVKPSNPRVAIIAAASPFQSLDGNTHAASTHDLNIRLISMGNTHRAITLTGAMCASVAAQIPGSLLNAIAQPTGDTLRIGTPSGILPASAQVQPGPNGPQAISAGTFRTFRRIMEGAVLYSPRLL